MANVQWNEFLERTDISNRGIAGDVTKGILSRINSVVALHPQVCFVDGGINDLTHEITPEKAAKNIQTIIDTLNHHHIKPILFLAMYTAKDFMWQTLIKRWMY